MNTIELNGLKFSVEIVYDEDAEAPWSREDGHGPVSDWTQRDKMPGERTLARRLYTSLQYRYYDFAEAVKIAKRDGWGVKDETGLTANQIATRAVELDYQRLKAWCEDEWHYVGVVVRLLDTEGNTVWHEHASLWGIESDDEKYHDQVARELAEEIAARVGDSNVVCQKVREDK
jgi:hypothetical protein